MKLLTVPDLCERWQFKSTRTVQDLLNKYKDILQPSKIAGVWRVNPQNVERFEQLMVPGASVCDHDYVYKILHDHTAADICTKCGHIKKQTVC